MENEVLTNLNELLENVEEKKETFINNLIASLDEEKRAEVQDVWNALCSVPDDIKKLQDNLERINAMESSVFSNDDNLEKVEEQEVVEKAENIEENQAEVTPEEDTAALSDNPEEPEEVIEEPKEEAVEEPENVIETPETDSPVIDEKAEEVEEAVEEISEVSANEAPEETDKVEEPVEENAVNIEEPKEEKVEEKAEEPVQEVVEKVKEETTPEAPAQAVELPMKEEQVTPAVEETNTETNEYVKESITEDRGVLVSKSQASKSRESRDKQEALFKTITNNDKVDSVTEQPAAPAPVPENVSPEQEIEEMMKQMTDEYANGNVEKAQALSEAISEKNKTLQKAA